MRKQYVKCRELHSIIRRPIVNFDVFKDIVLNGASNKTVTVHTDKKIKRKKGEGAGVSIIS